MKNKFVGLHLDFIGFSASMLCAIHCAAIPFLLSLAPLAGLQFLENHWIEYTIIILSLIIASNALVHGYRKHHKKVQALLLALGGFLLIALGHIMHTESQEMVFASSGGVTIALAHLVNWKHIKKSKAEFPDCLPEENA